jgi:hypothetical protein
MGGGTTFHFVDASPTEALETAREAADGQDVRIGGGPTIIRDFLAAGLVDYMHAVSDLLGAWPHTDPILRKRIARGRDDGGNGYGGCAATCRKPSCQ